MLKRVEILALREYLSPQPLVARGQQPGKRPSIGLLGSTTPSAESLWTVAFVARLHELGWIEGRTVTIEYRWAEGRTECAPEIAAEFVRLKIDVLSRGEPHSSLRQSRQPRSSR